MDPSRTAPLFVRSFLLMLDYVWMLLLALDLWDMVIVVLRSTKNRVQPKHTSHEENVAVLDSKNKTQNVMRNRRLTDSVR